MFIIVYSYGSRLVRVFGYEENEEVAEVATNAGMDSYWIGKHFGRRLLSHTVVLLNLPLLSD